MITKLSRRIVSRPKLVIVVALLLLIPSLLGYIGTRVNYDVLSYLPKDIRSNTILNLISAEQCTVFHSVPSMVI